jgi:hypothetical protein
MSEIRAAALRGATVLSPAHSEAATRFAAEELHRYLRRLTGGNIGARFDPAVPPQSIRVVTHDDVPSGSLNAAAPLPGDAAYRLSADAGVIRLDAASPRALLAAVYALLEQLGCRWSLHGPEEETIPALDAATVSIIPVTHRPAFRLRGYCADIMTWHYTQPEQFQGRLEDDRRFIDWMGKSGGNTFFFIRHPFDTQLTIPELRPDFERRGIRLEYGGHVIPLLLPRELFATNPEYFPVTPAGERTDNGNLCSSSVAALQTAGSNALSYVRDYPELSALHIWGADLWKGGWCRCPQCAGIGPQDQSLRVCNAVAETLARSGLAQPACYLAYHDTIDADLSERPAVNVVCEFAPRERCYGHAINDSQCATNRRYARALEGYLAHFDGRVRIFEYYGDAILFFGCALPLTAVIAADMAYYRSLGIRDVLMLQFGRFSLWAYPLNFLAFAAACDGRNEVDTGASYCVRFGSEAALAQSVLRDLEQTLRHVVTYGDIRLKPRSAPEAARLQSQLAGVLPQLGALAQRLDGSRHPELRAQAALLRYTQSVLAGVEHEIRTGASADAIFADALRLIETVDRRIKGLWGEIDLPIIHNLYAAAQFVESS